MPLKIDKSNYETYKKIYEVFWQFQIKVLQSEGVPAGFDIEGVSPIKILEKWEVESKAKALKGLKAGLPDLINNFALNAPQDILHSIDDQLKVKNLPGFFELHSKSKETLNVVLKRKKIKSLTEYYIINEIVSDTTQHLNSEDRIILNEALADFEVGQKP